MLKNISIAQKHKIEKEFYDQLFSHTMWKNAKSIGLTMAQNFEWATSPIIEMAWKQNKLVSIPKSNPTLKSLQFYFISSFQDVEPGYYNLLEPKHEVLKKADKQQIDLLIVPGLLFTQAGYRLGFGGGYFDRFLSDFTKDTLSLVCEMQIVDNLPINHFDVPVQTLIIYREGENGIG